MPQIIVRVVGDEVDVKKQQPNTLKFDWIKFDCHVFCNLAKLDENLLAVAEWSAINSNKGKKNKKKWQKIRRNSSEKATDLLYWKFIC